MFGVTREPASRDQAIRMNIKGMKQHHARVYFVTRCLVRQESGSTIWVERLHRFRWPQDFDPPGLIRAILALRLLLETREFPMGVLKFG